MTVSPNLELQQQFLSDPRPFLDLAIAECLPGSHIQSVRNRGRWQRQF
jgi:hypothetical protein